MLATCSPLGEGKYHRLKNAMKTDGQEKDLQLREAEPAGRVKRGCQGWFRHCNNREKCCMGMYCNDVGSPHCVYVGLFPLQEGDQKQAEPKKWVRTSEPSSIAWETDMSCGKWNPFHVLFDSDDEWLLNYLWIHLEIESWSFNEWEFHCVGLVYFEIACSSKYKTRTVYGGLTMGPMGHRP